jgi:cell pole-organizing protein PopZ
MAEVQDPAQTTREPSMEEILASIRKIISDEQDPAAAAGAGSDVIELTQAVQDDGSVVDVKAASPPPKPPEEPPVPAFAPPPPPAPEPVKAAAPPPPSAPEKPLVSEPTAKDAAAALSGLANTVQIERLAAAPHTSTFIGNSARTLEDMVIELMRPLLKEWLDANLPGTVERLVQKEIERISRRAEKD